MYIVSYNLYAIIYTPIRAICLLKESIFVCQFEKLNHVNDFSEELQTKIIKKIVLLLKI